MTDQVRKILDCYRSENPGVLTNLARILNHGRLGGTGRMIILPVDQGFEHGPARSFGPNPLAYDPAYHFQLAIDAGLNAYASPVDQRKAMKPFRRSARDPRRRRIRLNYRAEFVPAGQSGCFAPPRWDGPCLPGVISIDKRSLSARILIYSSFSNCLKNKAFSVRWL